MAWMRDRRRPVWAFSERELGERPGRAVAAGRARPVVRGVYTSDLTTPLPRLVRAHLWELLSHFVPDALIVDRSAGPMLFEGDVLFVSSQARARDLLLPGLRVDVRRGHGPLADDPLWMGGLHRSSVPRALVENLKPSRARPSRSSNALARTLSDDELATWVAQLAQQYPAVRLHRFRDRAQEIAADLGLTSRLPLLDELFGAALGTRSTGHGGLLAATVRGRAWDLRRLARFTQLAEDLSAETPGPEPARLPVLNPAAVREQAFFEAYLSNFIEGTEFTPDEAVRIVYDQAMPAARPEDAHDVLSTYQLITDPAAAGLTPASGPDLLEQLCRQHARLMAARPDKRPGQFKQEGNRVGSYDFVAPALVTGTLERGYALRDQLELPFARAVFMMFLLTEVHPFDDGNGRLARLAMNAELSAAGQHRILIPLIIRNDYLSGLRRLSRDGDPRLLVRVLARAWRWSSQIDFSSLEAARYGLESTHALVDATDAERTGLHLLLPSDVASP